MSSLLCWYENFASATETVQHIWEMVLWFLLRTMDMTFSCQFLVHAYMLDNLLVLKILFYILVFQLYSRITANGLFWTFLIFCWFRIIFTREREVIVCKLRFQTKLWVFQQKCLVHLALGPTISLFSSKTQNHPFLHS